jgi:2,3-bisphosphoglycerate-independent phosphoglycerate mutase
VQAAIAHVKRSGGTFHLMGLLSDGRVHSSLEHLYALIDAAVAGGVPIAVHCFLDGRDTPPRSAETYVMRLEEKLAAIGRQGSIASAGGRYYAMDRDKRWERTERAYAMLATGRAEHRAPTALDAVRSAYERGEDDEFVLPTIVGEPRPIEDGDACIFFNFRPDRARQLTTAFDAGIAAYGRDAFVAFAPRRYGDVLFATMTKYEEDFPNPVLFGPRPQYDTFGEILARAGLRQLRLAETEKYAHVTYFFNGGREDEFEGEDRVLIPSDRSVPTYDLAPAMRAREITDAAVAAIAAGTYDAIVMNYANADMIGHTGKWEPTIQGLEVLDGCLERLAAATLKAGGLLVITADHGNAEEKLDRDGNPLTAHTTNPVPLLFVADGLGGTFAGGGKLGDVAPTLLRIMNLAVPERMSGVNLFTPKGAAADVLSTRPG